MGKVRCTWFEKGRRCPEPPRHEHWDVRDRLWAWLCDTHQAMLEAVVKTGKYQEIEAVFRKAGGRED